MQRLLLSLFLILLATSWVKPAHAAQPPEKPDVLLICIDDLNDWIGALGGHPQARTPNIDRLAARGMLFTNAHCQSPVCLSSRASFMSGRLPSSTGVYLLGPALRESPQLKDVKMLPELFAEHGYQTTGTGKVFHGGGDQQTFQSYGPRGDAGPVLRGANQINHKVGHPLWDWGAYPEKDEQMPDYVCATWAVERLKEQRDKPLFLAVGFNRPHVPMYAPQKWFDLQPPLDQIVLPEVLDTDRDDLPDYGQRLTAGFPAPRHAWMLENDQWRKCIQAYLASITFVDAQVGRLLEALDASGRADKTIIVLLSDHGFHMGEKQRWAKRSLWEESTRVPLIIVDPAFEAGRRTDQPAGLIDIYPTLVELCGLPEQQGLEGRSLVPQMLDPASDRAPTITTWWVGNHAIRSKQYRYIRYADGSEEFYDHAKDPHEWHNLAADPAYAAQIAEHRKHLPATDHPALKSNTALGCAPEDRAFFNVPN